MINTLHNRLIDISFKNKLSHLSSCITSLPIIYDIYKKKKEEDIFILSNGHAGLALYVVLEHFYRFNAEDLLHTHGVHPNIDTEHKIYCSTGSLGLGLPVGIGYAISNLTRKIYVLISDGEAKEGSIWESLNFIDTKQITNIEVNVNVNGYSAYDIIDQDNITRKLKSFLNNIVIHYTNLTKFPLLDNMGIESHYYILKTEDERNTLLL